MEEITGEALLEELLKVEPNKLGENAQKLFYTIMKLIDERNELQEEKEEYKEIIQRIKECIESKNDGVCVINGEIKGAYTFVTDFDKAREFIWELLDILNEVE